MAMEISERTSDAKVLEATGRGWDGWFEWLHDHGADELDHKAIVRLLDEDGELASGWWRQSVTVAFEQHIGRRVPGAAQDGTFDVTARRTFRSTPARAWQLLASPDGASAWLGDVPSDWFSGEWGPEVGEVLETPGGERYEVRSCKPGARIRLRTLGPALPRTTILLSLAADRGRTVVSLSQEGLPEQDMREPMREHWKRALDRIGELLDGE